MQSNSFAQNNQDPNAVQLFTANTSNSSVQYTRNIGSKLRTSVGVQVNQNFSTKVFNFNSSYNIGLNQFNPFIKEENQTGRWIEQFRVGLDIQGGFQATNDITGLTRSTTYTEYQVYGVSNEPLTEEELRLQALGQQDNVTVLSLLDDFDRIVSENGQFRTTYTVPISLPNFKLAKFINITPSVNYRGEIFTQRLNYEFFERDTTFTRDGEPVVLTGIDENFGAVRIDTTNGFYNTYNVSAGISMNTRIYGTYQFKGKGRLQAIRHTIAPSVSMNYTPDLKDNTSLFTKTRVRSDDPEERYLSRFPALGSVPGASGLVSFSLTNQLEAKLRSKNSHRITKYSD
ncbi:MAG: putative LPS assembly protein LptD, partial [Spirosomaceae bacterium]|nr:putative LPS assembly protein LptD [Spirosomataceae bacterium]